MNSDIILDFSALDRLAEEKNLSVKAQKFLYLIWLGVPPKEACSALYNTAVRILEWNDSTLYVKDDKAAMILGADGGKSLDKNSSDAAAKELAAAGISSALVSKMGFFNMRYEQSELGQPEDIVRVSEIARHIGLGAEELENEYKLYCRRRKAEQKG